MRRLLATAILFIIIAHHALAQCGSDTLSALQRQLAPDYDRIIQENNHTIREYIQKAKSSSVQLTGNGLPEDGVYTIPVVVHVVYPAGEAYGSGTNISYAQIRSQLEALNAAFSRAYPAYNGQRHPGYAHNPKIRFCLARNPSPASASWAMGPGGLEYGVKRYPDISGVYHHQMTVASTSSLVAITHTSTNHFPFDKYLNIWLVKTINGGNNIMGYAKLPIASAYPLDGIVMRVDVFGDNTTGNGFPLGFHLMQGKILAHEMGHYLNLHHIFQDGCSGTNGPGAVTDACDLNGDYICDTRPCTTQNVSCSDSALTTCAVQYDPGTSPHDMINNYMSYADDDCMNTFTNDQVQRMWATLQLQRKNLWQADNLAATGVLGSGCVPAYLNAGVAINSEVLCVGKPILFKNPKAGNTALTRQWQFAGGKPVSVGSDTVSVVYDTPGNYTAVITVGDGSRTLSDSLRFTVVACTLDSSLQYMAHWYFGNYCSIDFSAGTAVKTSTAFTNKSIHFESAYTGQIPYMGSSISVSDSLGNLLFYSNGISIWNSSHVKITADPIFGSSDIHYSSGLCYIPYPGQPGKYFIVGVYPRFDNKPEGIRFVLVDVATGSVTPYQECSHPLLPPRFAQQLTIVPHCNGTDYWIITKGKGSWDFDYNFYALKVTSSGIDSNQEPVVSTGFTLSAYGGAGYQLKANRAGDKLFLTSFETALYDFDSRTGKVSNEKFIPQISGYSNIQTGAAFSPDGQYVYIIRSSNLATNGKPYWLFQYRISDLKYNIIPTTGFYFAQTFQLGPDNQLYILNGDNYLARLANPDNWGGAMFDDRYISFRESSFTVRGGSGLPSFIDAKRKEPWHPDFTMQPTGCQSYTFSALCFENYTATWNFGDGTPLVTGHSISHTYAKSGAYSVTLTISSSTQTYGSITKKLTALPSAIQFTGPDSVCVDRTFVSQYFAPTLAGADYRWSAIDANIVGENNRSFIGIDWSKEKDSATVKLEVSLGSSCILNASKTVYTKRGSVPGWILADSICITSKSIVLSASPTGGIFSGSGINNSIFLPDSAGLGNHILTYQYGKGSICHNAIQKVIRVHNHCDSVVPVVVPTVPVVPPVTSGGLPDSTLIPNVFSPNNDGINDTWRIGYLQAFPNAVINVYDRYGKRVFHSMGSYNEWDGRYNGKSLPVGTYYYVIISVLGQKPLSGSISILR